jgi:hypothetical protein
MAGSSPKAACRGASAVPPRGQRPARCLCVSGHETRQADGQKYVAHLCANTVQANSDRPPFQKRFQSMVREGTKSGRRVVVSAGIGRIGAEPRYRRRDGTAYLRKPDGEQDEDFLEERFPLMVAWQQFLISPRSRRPSRRSRATEWLEKKVAAANLCVAFTNGLDRCRPVSRPDLTPSLTTTVIAPATAHSSVVARFASSHTAPQWVMCAAIMNSSIFAVSASISQTFTSARSFASAS